MIRVIESLLLDKKAIEYVPEFLEALGPGLMVTVDVDQPVDAEGKPSALLVEPGSTVRIHRPDGTAIDRVVSGVSVSGPKVSLYFPNTEKHEIPRLSEIELPA